MTLRRSFDNVDIPQRSESSPAREILSQETFHRVISLERRRTERSRKPFMLMLVDSVGHQSEIVRENLGKLLAVLSASTRETDVIGWYESDRVAGGMFTEIGAGDRATIVTAMTARLNEILHSNLSIEQFRISFHVFPEDWDLEMRKRPSNPPLYPDLSKRNAARRISGALKRGMDIVGSMLALVLCTPLFLGIALAIKATSRGPVFFRQRRIGQHGVPFVFLKFRSMHVGNDANIHKEYVTRLIAGKAQRNPSNGNGEGVFKLTQDPRITRVGAFLRRTSLDELPQFINVFKGEMSLVGPRPPVPYEVEAYDLWHRRRLLEAKPGITGLWQVSGRSRVTFDEMVRLDLRYARTWSLWMDIKILWRTPGAVVLGEGAH
ncbi:MAG TPA: sugar transferase [Terriglobales bacterium]|nr:sugar transferase [Terriglobales bacterium]